MNPDGPMALKDRVIIRGECMDMCPEFERVQRIAHDDVLGPEMVYFPAPPP